MQGTHSNRRLEGWLDQLIGDKSLRDEFFVNPALACANAGIDLSWTEVGALLALPPAYFDEFARGLAVVPGGWSERPLGARAH